MDLAQDEHNHIARLQVDRVAQSDAEIDAGWAAKVVRMHCDGDGDGNNAETAAEILLYGQSERPIRWSGRSSYVHRVC